MKVPPWATAYPPLSPRRKSSAAREIFVCGTLDMSVWRPKTIFNPTKLANLGFGLSQDFSKSGPLKQKPQICLPELFQLHKNAPNTSMLCVVQMISNFLLKSDNSPLSAVLFAKRRLALILSAIMKIHCSNARPKVVYQELPQTGQQIPNATNGHVRSFVQADFWEAIASPKSACINICEFWLRKSRPLKDF